MLNKACALLLLLAGTAASADHYGDWIYFRKITLNTTATGANITSNVFNFPILVRLSTADSLVFKKARGGGQDIRFNKSNGVHVPYHIERWDSASGDAAIWVLLDTVKANLATQAFFMYFGNAAAADSSWPKAVFDTAYGFLGTYHFNGGVTDVTPNFLNGRDHGSYDTVGCIGRGRRFKESCYFDIGKRSSMSSGAISCWVRPASTFDNSILVSQGIWGTKADLSNNATLTFRSSGFSLGSGQPGCIQSKIEENGASAYVATTTASFTGGTWYHVAWTWGGGGEDMYLNGLNEATLDSSKTVPNDTQEIGRSLYDTANVSGGGPRYLYGTLDEFRVDKVYRSASWIKLCYKNQRFTNGGDSLTVPGAITPMAPESLSYTLRTAVYPAGAAITPNAAIMVKPSGGVADSFTVSPSLPAGLLLTKATGAISGTPSAVVSAQKCTVTVWNVSGSAKCALTITVYNRPTITQQPASVTVNPGASATFTVAASGSTPLSYQWWRGASSVSGATAATYSTPAVTSADDGAIFKCVVRYNSTVDSAWSGPCTLHVATPPAITLQPASARVRRGGSASFSIAASGTPPLTYAWIKGAADTVAGAAGPSITVLSAQKTDDMARYRCVVRNGAGAATSLPCTLRVVAAGFEAAPRNGIDSLTVLFTDSSTGGISAYSWNFGDGSPAGAAASPSHRYDSVGVYSVVLAVSAGGVADTARCADCINVKHAKPAVAFEADTFYAIDSLTVHFFDLTKGVVTAKRWDFGDGAADSSPADTVAHRYGDTGTYTVKLVESGPGGVDSLVKRDCIKVRSKGEYPVFVEARRLSTESVEISFYNYMSIITSRKSPMPPWADSMGLWFSRDSIPTSPSDSLIAGYNIIAMQQSGREPYVDTVRVPFSAPADSVFYGFNTAAFWVNQPANAMKAGNGDIVLMRDTTPPKNPLTISGAYLAIDSFALYLDAVSSLDTHAIDSVGIWYGFKRANDFTDAQHTRWFSLSTIIASSSGNRFALTLRESRLNGDTVRLYCAALVIGRNRLKSAVVDSTFTAGRPHPENPIRLAAAARSPTSIFLTWKDKNTGKPITSVDNILIWRGRQPLPLTYSPPPEDFVALRPAVGDTAFLCGELNEKTRYYFGAQILSQGLWSSITEGASATDSTPQIEAAERPANTITMTNLYFDAGRNRIVVCWRVDSLDTAMEVGIAHSTVSFPRDSAAPPGQIIKTAALDSAAADVRKLEWDSTYYVTLWLRKKDGKWALPTDKSQRSLKLPADVSWQVVQYFTKYPDTVTVFSGRLKLAGADANPVPTTDTVRRCEASPASLKGFAAVSRCFAFVQHQAGAPFFIGVRYDADSIPSPYTAKDVRIYFEKEGEIFLQKTAFLDTARCMVWTLASDISAPIIALVDTAWPVVEVRSHPDEPVVSGRAFTDTFLISDNIANTRYWYRYAKGDGGEAAADSHETEASKAIVRASVKGQIVNQESGVRAALYVSDGPHTVAVDVSRQVIRDSTADAISAVANKWRPLKVAALLDSPSVKRMLKDLYVNGNWYYDNTEFRLFRWYAFAGNASDSVKWVEYSDTNDWMFSLEPCRLLWIKTRKNVALHGGKGRTSSLRKCYSVAAAPHTWTDIALPFGFSVCVGDIIDSTGGGGRGDSLQFYSWKADASGQYRCRPLYIADFAMKSASIANRSDSISKADGAFSVYNPLSSAVTISIPPIPPALSGYGPAKAKPGKRSGKDEGWAVRVAGRTQSGMEVSEVYCGYREGAPGARYYPLPMSLSRVGIGVCDGGKRLHGHGLARGSWDKENGVLFPLAFYNGSDRAETIAYAVENLESLPGSVKALIFDGETGLCEDASAPSAVQTAEGKTRYRHLAIGTDAYLKKVKQRMQGWRLGLASAFSTPFGHALKIRFTLPFAGVSGVRFAMVDLMGRTVWDDRIICGGASGMQEYVWRGSAAGRRPVVPGIYILRMVAWDEKRCVVGAFERKVSYLP